MKKNITNINKKGNFDGYQEWYNRMTEKLIIRGLLKHNKPYYYYEDHVDKNVCYFIK